MAKIKIQDQEKFNELLQQYRSQQQSTAQPTPQITAQPTPQVPQVPIHMQWANLPYGMMPESVLMEQPQINNDLLGRLGAGAAGAAMAAKPLPLVGGILSMAPNPILRALGLGITGVTTGGEMLGQQAVNPDTAQLLAASRAAGMPGSQSIIDVVQGIAKEYPQEFAIGTQVGDIGSTAIGAGMAAKSFIKRKPDAAIRAENVDQPIKPKPNLDFDKQLDIINNFQLKLDKLPDREIARLYEASLNKERRIILRQIDPQLEKILRDMESKLGAGNKGPIQEALRFQISKRQQPQ